jgi:hypothetical protein
VQWLCGKERQGELPVGSQFPCDVAEPADEGEKRLERTIYHSPVIIPGRTGSRHNFSDISGPEILFDDLFALSLLKRALYMK